MHCCKFAGCKLQVQCCRFGVELSRSSPGAAFLAKSGISIPAAIRANPLAAPAASAEKGLCLFDRPLAGSVMSLAPNRALGLAAAAGAGQNAANYIARCSQQVSRCSTAPRLKSGHVSVSAFVAIVFEATGELLATRLAGLHYFRTGMAKIDRALLPAFG